MRRLQNNPGITTAMIVDAIRARKNIIDLQKKMPLFKSQLNSKHQKAIEEVKDDEDKKSKLEEVHRKKLEKLVKIEQYLEKTDRVSLKASDEIFLNKISLPGKQ